MTDEQKNQNEEEKELDGLKLLKAGIQPDTNAGNGNDQDSGQEKKDSEISIDTLTKLFPQFEILECLGRGGMGIVYKVKQKVLDRFAALKILRSDLASKPQFSERFAREAKSLAKLSHPNIITVYDCGCVENCYYFLMEYIDGTNLRRILNTGPIKPEEALAIIPQICDALQYAHDEGIVHRDIKPENILMDKKGHAKVADFGLAKMLGLMKDPAQPTLTETGTTVGTPYYMAPEQIEHPLDVDQRADVYALGVILYEMLTGELPVGRFTPPSKRVQMDVRLDEVVLRALEKDPEMRYQQVSDIKVELGTISSNSGVQNENSAKSGVASGADYSFVSSKKKGIQLWHIVMSIVILMSAIIFIVGTFLGFSHRKVLSGDDTQVSSVPLDVHSQHSNSKSSVSGTMNLPRVERYDNVNQSDNQARPFFNFKNETIDRVLESITAQTGVNINPRGSIHGNLITVISANRTVEEILKFFADKYGWKVRKIDDKNYEIMDVYTYRNEVLPQLTEIRIFTLKYASPNSVLCILSPFITPVAGNISANEDMKKIVVKDLPEVLDKLQVIINELDVDISTPKAEDTTQKLK